MSPEDGRLVAALLMLGDRVPSIVDEITAGTFDESERCSLSVVLATIAADLDPRIVVKHQASLGPGRAPGPGEAGSHRHAVGPRSDGS